MSHTDNIEKVLRAGGVITLDGGEWTLDSAHPEEDMPTDIAAQRDGEDDDAWLERQGAWWDSLRRFESRAFLCERTTGLIEALAHMAGVRVRKP